MRYALILSFVLGFSAVAFPLQADEVGSGFCKTCVDGNFMTTQTVEVGAVSTNDTETTSGKTSSNTSWRIGNGGWWSLMLELFAIEK